jgi:site-specific DNA-methyltransferase (adenine-specific)
VIDVRHGDSRDVIKTLADASIDSVVCDPPYALVSIVKRFGGENSAPAKDGDVYARSSRGFMGKQWDTGEVAFNSEFWRDVMRVLKPGAHLLAFGGTRTYHRLAVAIEDAGFEIRDQIGWLYGSGFPKSHNIGNGWGTALKPAWEPIVMARKPFKGTVAANVQAHGTGALNVDGCRVGTNGGTAKGSKPMGEGNGIYGAGLHGACEITQLSAGRWPANVIHDGSEEVLAAFPESGPAKSSMRGEKTSAGTHAGWARESHKGFDSVRGHDDTGGSAARFFYSAKADAGDRLGSKHPTVKPVDLMAYLCRLVAPPGGTVLDPFAGSGTTGMACMREGFNAVLIEREAEYVADIKRRIAHVSGDDAPLFSTGDTAA